MSEIGGVAGATAAPSGSTQTAGSSLGKDDFLRLLTAQLRYQDPMSPMDDKDFMGQMAQFTSLEQLTNVAGSMERLSFASQVTESVGLLGRTVFWDGESGEQSGAVDGVSIADGAIHLRVGDTEIVPGQVRRVE